MILQKKCVGLNRNSSEKAGFNKKTFFLLVFKETGSTHDIYEKLPYQCVCSLHY